MALIRLNVIDPSASNDYIESLTGKPVGNPPALDDLNRLGEVNQGNFTYVSVGLAKELGFGFGSVSGSANKRVMTFDYATTANQADQADNGIESWTYGAGYRIGILASNVEASMGVGLPALAAKATLERTDIQVQILNFGMPGGPKIPVPEFAQFDVMAYGLFTQWQKDALDYIDANRDSLRPVRIYASLKVDVDQYFENTAPLRYALRRLQDRTPLSSALKEATDKQISNVVGHDPVIRAVYARVTGLGAYLNSAGPIDDQAIPEQAKSTAERWINEYDKI